jgi:3-mercaptopyruvate sulfurtransferase SseA
VPIRGEALAPTGVMFLHRQLATAAAYEWVESDTPSQTDRVTPQWLESRLDDPYIRVIESGSSAKRYYRGHIPGAARLEYVTMQEGSGQEVCVLRTTFDAFMSRLGASRETTVVFYGDDSGDRWPSYALALFQLFGHANLRIVDGGRARWIRERRPFTTAVPSFAPTWYRSAWEHDAPHRVFHHDVVIAAEGRARMREADVEVPRTSAPHPVAHVKVWKFD